MEEEVWRRNIGRSRKWMGNVEWDTVLGKGIVAWKKEWIGEM